MCVYVTCACACLSVCFSVSLLLLLLLGSLSLSTHLLYGPSVPFGDFSRGVELTERVERERERKREREREREREEYIRKQSKVGKSVF